ncbi:AMP-binding protein [Flavobacterium myungsuense]|uniref:AMP-binding protein n=1 Tax=Flavobacterium myungsuense TaxID=651823 RepID=A0ABW3J4J5_9FLAO
MIPTYHNVHNSFKLNGFHFNRESLLRVAYSFIKEGEDFEKPIGDFLLDWFDDKTYIDLQTSGTTGAPKTIRTSKQAMVESAIATADFFGLKPGNKALHCLPVKYIAGKLMFVRAFIIGLDMDFVAPSATPFQGDIVNRKYDFIAMVPLQAKNSLKELNSNVKKVIIGGSMISKALQKDLLKIATKVYETYGMTETITHIAAREIKEKSFTVLPEITISHDYRNCLVIHAPRISDDLIVTNDIVELVGENQFQFIGRYDNIINSGGIKLIPEQVEEKLSGKIPSRFFVTGKSDEKLGEKLILVVEGDKKTIDESVFDTLDKYEKPKEVIFVPKFKQTENGKILRKETSESL